MSQWATTSTTQFAACVNNEGYVASLEVGKIYGVLPNDDAMSHGLLRVIDETGEDYGYPARRFYSIVLPVK